MRNFVICTVSIIEESGFGGTSSTRGAKIKKKDIYGTCTVLVEASEDEETLGTNSGRWEDNTELCLKENIWVDVEWTELANRRVHWRTVKNMIKYF